MKQPNIVFIMADDMGYGDPGCYNPDSLTPTPCIDRLAREGVRFTHAHAGCAVCPPTRYGLMTGRFQWRNDQIISLTDMMATFAELTGYELNDQSAEVSISVLQALRGSNVPPPRPGLIAHTGWHVCDEGDFSVQHEHWKLVEINPSPDKGGVPSSGMSSMTSAMT